MVLAACAIRAVGITVAFAVPLSFADLPPIGTPGKVIEAAPTGLLQIERLTLSNGVKVLMWNNDAEPGRIMVKVRFGQGFGDPTQGRGLCRAG